MFIKSREGTSFVGDYEKVRSFLTVKYTHEFQRIQRHVYMCNTSINAVSTHILEYIYTHTGLCVFSSFLLQVSSMNESNDIPAEILEQHPEIETFDKVFADVGRT